MIKIAGSISRVLRYNEEKLQAGDARFLGESNCPFDGGKVPLLAKLNYLEGIAGLSPSVQKPGVHISLNFPPSEEQLPDAVFYSIAKEYMEQVGFGAQPWLAYRHFDAGHPHLHIVSLRIRPDGSRIDMHNIGRNQSEDARKAIEKEYGLIPAEKHPRLGEYQPQALTASRLSYGKMPTKRALGQVIQFALQYQFGSLAELNALLGLYNVRADTGKATSRTYLGGGVLYRAIDTQGNAVGVPIKASDFHFKPTLSVLEHYFKKGKQESLKPRIHLCNTVDGAIASGRVMTIQDLHKRLQAVGVDLVIRQNPQGMIYGLTYVDHTARCVVNGSALGKRYSAKGILERLNGSLREDARTHQPSAVLAPQSQAKPGTAGRPGLSRQDAPTDTPGTTLADALLHPENAYEADIPGYHQTPRKKKRKGRK